MKILFILFITTLILNTKVQSKCPKILHFTKTTGYDHKTRKSSFEMFSSLSLPFCWELVDDSTGTNFNNLDSFDLIIFSNTSGIDLLTQIQRNNFEKFINRGGSLVGIHAATDTYRHSEANGERTGIWDFYSNVLGGSVQNNPNHVKGTPQFQITKPIEHPITDNIPEAWEKEEEYYYWEKGYLKSDIVSILDVEKTIGPNGNVNSYDSARSVAWIREHNTGSRVFYTSLGHSRINYTSESLFKNFLESALLWCLDTITATPDTIQSKIKIHPNPLVRNSILRIELNHKAHILIIDQLGKIIIEETTNENHEIFYEISIPGYYLIIIRTRTDVFTYRLTRL